MLLTKGAGDFVSALGTGTAVSIPIPEAAYIDVCRDFLEQYQFKLNLSDNETGTIHIGMDDYSVTSFGTTDAPKKDFYYIYNAKDIIEGLIA